MPRSFILVSAFNDGLFDPFNTLAVNIFREIHPEFDKDSIINSWQVSDRTIYYDVRSHRIPGNLQKEIWAEVRHVTEFPIPHVDIDISASDASQFQLNISVNSQDEKGLAYYPQFAQSFGDATWDEHQRVLFVYGTGLVRALYRWAPNPVLMAHCIGVIAKAPSWWNDQSKFVKSERAGQPPSSATSASPSPTNPPNTSYRGPEWVIAVRDKEPVPYPEAVQQQLEAAFQAKDKEAEIWVDGKRFTCNFRDMYQSGPGGRKPIRREQPKGGMVANARNSRAPSLNPGASEWLPSRDLKELFFLHKPTVTLGSLYIAASQYDLPNVMELIKERLQVENDILLVNFDPHKTYTKLQPLRVEDVHSTAPPIGAEWYSVDPTGKHERYTASQEAELEKSFKHGGGEVVVTIKGKPFKVITTNPFKQISERGGKERRVIRKQVMPALQHDVTPPDTVVQPVPETQDDQQVTMAQEMQVYQDTVAVLHRHGRTETANALNGLVMSVFASSDPAIAKQQPSSCAPELLFELQSVAQQTKEDPRMVPQLEVLAQRAERSVRSNTESVGGGFQKFAIHATFKGSPLRLDLPQQPLTLPQAEAYVREQLSKKTHLPETVFGFTYPQVHPTRERPLRVDLLRP
eukprot:NODE_157_length_2081_cov_83.264074_g133_i0.p1 GENE.NODE_157_length_2081_cov_83.264074_g133_i0~~NODE_157_length_2081_cov_83.264074_g133_i0.p1  ORF type:complete len:632 (+),score=79.40 NODE_157_length_2081_cov_83.264074_g133_i0:72-1967(+)